MLKSVKINLGSVNSSNLGNAQKKELEHVNKIPQHSASKYKRQGLRMHR